MNLDELIREADPVRQIDPVDVESHEARSLYRQIVEGGRRIESSSDVSTESFSVDASGPGRVVAQIQHLREPRKWVAVAAAAVLIVGLGIVYVADSTGGKAQRAGVTGPPTSATWRLVSDAGPVVQLFAATGASPQGLDEMSCPTTQVCYLESSVTTGSATTAVQPTINVYQSTNGGLTWLPITMPPGITLDTPLSCFSANDCMVGAQTGGTIYSAVGTIQTMLITTNGGSSWTSQQVLMPPVTGEDAALDSRLVGLQGSLTQLQCFSSESCIAFGTVPSDQPEEPLNEPGNLVARTVVMRTHDGGNTWSSSMFPWSTTPTGGPAWSSQQVATFSCPSESACFGVATVLGQGNASGAQAGSLLDLRSTNGGASWSSSWVPNVQGDATNLTCTDQTHCFATVTIGAFGLGATKSGVLVTSDSGTTWSFEQLSPEANGDQFGISSLSCPSSNTCWASGYQRSTTNAKLTAGAMFATLDGGQTWTPVHLPSGLGIVTQVDCASTQSCLAIAQPPYPSGAPAPSGPTPSDVLTNQSLQST
jgi:hypothetical protein